MTVKMEKLKEYAQKVAKKENCILYDIEMAGSHSNPVLRVFIDKESHQGVSIDDCSQVSKGLDMILDREDLVSRGTYQLEVSSPGLERHLSESWHFMKAVGKKINIQLKTNLGDIKLHSEKGDEKRKKITGQLLKANESSIEMALTDKETDSVIIPYNLIGKAKVVFHYPTNNFNKKKLNKKRG